MFNRVEFTRYCLPMAMQNAGMDAQWLLIDDGSTDKTLDFLRSPHCKGATVLADGFNKGIAARKNEAMDYFLKTDCDFQMNIDNDILLPFGWLRDMMAAFQSCPYDLGSAWIINDRTIWRMVGEQAQKAPSLNRWIETEGCGAACTVKTRKLITSGVRWYKRGTGYAYGDAAFHSSVLAAGFKIGIYLGVQAWHVQNFIWTDGGYERMKLAERHATKTGSLEGLDASLARLKEGMIIS